MGSKRTGALPMTVRQTPHEHGHSDSRITPRGFHVAHGMRSGKVSGAARTRSSSVGARYEFAFVAVPARNSARVSLFA